MGASAALRFHRVPIEALRPRGSRSARREWCGRRRGDDQRVQPRPDFRAAAGYALHVHGAGEARSLGHRPALGLGSSASRPGAKRRQLHERVPHAAGSDPAARGAVHVRGDRRLRHGHSPSVDGDQTAARGRAGAAARRGHRERAPDPDDRRQHLRVAAIPALDEGFRRRRRRLVLHVLSALPLRDQPGAGVPVHRQPRHPRDRGMRRPRPGDGQLLPGDAAGQRGSGGPRLGGAGAVLPLPRRVRRRVRLPRYVEGALLQARPALLVSEAPRVHHGRVPGAACRADRAGGSRSAITRRSARGRSIATPTGWRS